ncbi:MAG TPA: PilZ domain-containing protein [Pyrinomonadaceae bacterium]|nr:PilZ domain-containing protein [Pyrinomonadaceae bacterium]
MEPQGKERRLKPRFNVRLPCTVALPEGERDILFPDAALRCRTRDLSETGVGLVAPSIYLGYTCAVDEGRLLLVELELPAGPVRMLAAAAHYLRLDRAGEEASYLIGLRINEMGDAARALFNGYLASLAAG